MTNGMWGIVDCDNFFVSCERVFRPDLNGQPVVVLSNNDGCIIARSNEAKAMGIKMGMPYYQMLEQYGKNAITAFSSNYELYGDMSARIMSILRSESPVVMQYSIDECFLQLHGIEPATLGAWGQRLSAKVLKWTDMPVSIGIAPTKTLAKVAVKFAKKYPAYRKCCTIMNDTQREKALKLTEISDVWGIGRRMLDKMEYYGIHTAFDLTQRSSSWVNREMHITGLRTWKELQAIDCIDIDTTDSTRKSICTSRSFAAMISDYSELSTHISNFAAHCAKKLRKQHSVCAMVSVFIETNRFRNDLRQYANSCSQTLLTPTSTSIEISGTALKLLKRIFAEGYEYKRAGVTVTCISDDKSIQTNFIDYDAERKQKFDRLTNAVDIINSRMGTDTVILGSQQYKSTDANGKHTNFANSIRRALKSPNYTNNPDEFELK